MILREKIDKLFIGNTIITSELEIHTIDLVTISLNEHYHLGK